MKPRAHPDCASVFLELRMGGRAHWECANLRSMNEVACEMDEDNTMILHEILESELSSEVADMVNVEL
jgi:hypothetical protein